MEKGQPRIEALAHNTKQMLIAIDQLVNALAGWLYAIVSALRLTSRPAGLWWADETISAHCWRWRLRGLEWPCQCVDALAMLFGDKNHCYEAWKSEKYGRQLPPCERPEQ